MFMYTFLPPASSDYTTVSMDLTFNAGSTNQTVMIPILGDTMVEELTESFTVFLTSVDSAVILNPYTTTVTIEDDDSKFFGIKEGGRRLICRDYTSLFLRLARSQITKFKDCQYFQLYVIP